MSKAKCRLSKSIRLLIVLLLVFTSFNAVYVSSSLEKDGTPAVEDGFRMSENEDKSSVQEEPQPFDAGTVSRTTESQIEWEDHHSMEGLETREDELVLEEMHQRSESYTGYTDVDVTDHTSIYVELEGGGGAAAYEGDATWYSPGGDGGALEGWFDVSDFETLEIWVGEGGEYSDNGGPGGWGRHSGGDGGDHAGGGGGSTEILADGTFLAAADAGGGGGAWWDYGVGYTTYGGGGGARGGQGGTADNPGEDAEGSGTGGDGADDSEEDGGHGSGEYNDAYWMGGPGWTKGGGGSGGEDPEDDGEDGSATIDFYGHEDQGERISTPLSLDKVDHAGESSIEWDEISTGNTDMTIYSAITESETTVPDNWHEATNGGPIPGIDSGDNLTSRYLWTRQVLSTTEGSETPRLNRMTETIVDYHTLTIDSTEGGEVIKPGESEFGYEYDSLVEIEAAPQEEGYRFIEWVGDTRSIEDSNSRKTTIEMVDDLRITAKFAMDTYTLDVRSTEGGNVVEPGEGPIEREHGEVVDLEAVAEEGYHFGQWTGDTETIDDTTAEATTITMNDDYTITAEFDETPELSVDIVEGDGSIEVEGEEVELPFSDYYSPGEDLELKAVPAEDHRFDHWEGDISGEESDQEEIKVVMDEDRVINAHFAERQIVEIFNLTVNIEGEGTVEVDGTEVEDGWIGEREDGSEVTIEAFPVDGWRFIGWTGDHERTEEKIINITIDDDINITAEFERIEHELTINIEGKGTTSPSEGIHTYPHGEHVTVEALSADGWDFDKWTGDLDTSEEEMIITMGEDKEIKAIFLREPIFKSRILSPEEGESFDLDEEIEIEFNITNQGDLKGSEVIELYVDGEYTGKNTELSIGPGESEREKFRWEPDEEGDFQLEIRCESGSADFETDVVEVSVADTSPLLPWWSYIVFIVIVLFLVLALYLRKRREEHEEVLPLKEPKISKIKKKREKRLEELEQNREENTSKVSPLGGSRSETSPPSSRSKGNKNEAVGSTSNPQQSSTEMCKICLSPANTENRLNCECGEVYHDDCLRVEGRCPECGTDFAEVSSATDTDMERTDEDSVEENVGDIDDSEEDGLEEEPPRREKEKEKDLELCPDCLSELKWLTEYKEWYCHDCKEYKEIEERESDERREDKGEGEDGVGIWTDKGTEESEGEEKDEEESVKCHICNRELDPGSDRCWACGAEIDDEEHM